MIHGIDTSFLIAMELDEHPSHVAAGIALGSLLAAGDRLALTPQVLDEFIHVVTDGRRLTQPLDIATAREVAERWWTSVDVDHVYPNEEAVSQFFAWINQFQLGRKRLLDTMLAATYFHNQVTSILTINPKDFAVLGVIHCPNLAPHEPTQGPAK